MEEVRGAAWEVVNNKQKENRESLLNKNRSLENLDNHHASRKDDVTKLANQLKKKHITFEELAELKEIFLQNKENITSFFEVDGALEALVRALSGKNAKLQLGAAYCLCNLSLGDEYMKLIKSAGSYLLLHLEGMNTYLIEACVWTLGNLSSHDKKCVELLKSQGALSHLSRLLSHIDDNISTATIYALSHFVYMGFDVLTPDDFQCLIEPVVKLLRSRPASVAYLMSIISSNPSCHLKLLQEGVHIESVNFLIQSLKENILQCSWYIRIIGNLVPETTGQAALQVSTHRVSRDEVETLFDAIEYIVQSGQIFLIKECCWLLGNLLNHQNEEISRMVHESNIFERISKVIRYLILQKDATV